MNARGVFVVACCWCTFTLCGSNQLSPVYLLSLLFHVVIGSSSSSTISFRISCDRSKFSVVVFFLPSPSLKTWYLLFLLCLLHICNECMSCFVRCVITIFGVERRCSSYSPTHLSPSLFRPFISLSPLTTHFRPPFPSNPRPPFRSSSLHSHDEEKNDVSEKCSTIAQCHSSQCSCQLQFIVPTGNK